MSKNLRAFRNDPEGLFCLGEMMVYLLGTEKRVWRMAKISFDRIAPLLVGIAPTDGVRSLLREIIVLQAKLDSPERQDFYFQKGRKSNEKRLEEMKVEYSRIVELVNGNDVDFFLEQIEDAERKIKAIEAKGYLSSIDRLAYNSFHSQVEYFKSLLQAKGQYKNLKTLDELMQDENALMEIFQ